MAETSHYSTAANSINSPVEVISEIRIGAKKLKASNMNSQSPKADTMEPDADAIKMFVGQVPRSMDENDLRKMFEEFGPIYQLNVLRDKVTGQSKGCCFITFYTRKAALDAQNQLHNIKTMPGMQHPVQMKPADSEKLEERKLFIGMLSKKSSENDVRMMFAPFGQIEECTVLREQNGSSKGCAFVTYASKQCATNCIKAMHHSQTMEGCRYPLVVKCADTQKEKEMKKIQQMNTNLLQNISAIGGSGGGGGGNIGGMNPQYLALLQQLMSPGVSNQQPQQQTPNMGGNIGNLGLGLSALQMPQLLAAAAAALQNNPAFAAALATLTSAMNNTNLASVAASNLPQTNGQSTHNGSSTSSTPNSAGDMNSLQNMQQIQGLAALAAMANNPALSGSVQPQNLAMLQQLLSSASQGQQMPNLGNTGSNSPNSSAAGSMSTSTSSMSNPSAPGMLGNYSHTLSSVGATGGGGGGSLSLGGSMNGMGGGAGSTAANNSQPTAGSSGPPSAMDTINQAYTGIQQYAGLSGLLSQASFPNAFSPPSATPLQQNSASPAGKQTEGPEGANLFIYHLPQEFSDHDLLQMFQPFGTVISSKVFIDKQTNLSKCFGFVSYDNAVSAQAAIQAMNGFQIGMKRLKVQLKRPKNESKPY